VSRLLRSLEQDGLVVVDPSESDRRFRTVRLIFGDREERQLLDLGSDELARSFLEPLSESRRRRLVAAMAEVERRPRRWSRYTRSIRRVPSPTSAYGRTSTSSAGGARGGFDPAVSISAGLGELRHPAGAFLLASLRGGRSATGRPW
jgi:hypothetical protein